MKQFSVVFYVNNNPIPQRCIATRAMVLEMVEDPSIIVSVVREIYI